MDYLMQDTFVNSNDDFAPLLDNTTVAHVEYTPVPQEALDKTDVPKAPKKRKVALKKAETVSHAYYNQC